MARQRQLRCFIGPDLVGTFTEGAGDKVTFAYDDAWLSAEGAHPLSLSLPLFAREHHGRYVRNFLANLLPDNDATLRRWGRDYRVSPLNPLALLEHVGRECAGALVLTPDASPPVGGGVRWLKDAELWARLAAEREARGAHSAGDESGAFSLAGAQPKLALRYDPQRKRFGEAQGREATTHILKPATGMLEAHAQNEACCMRIAARLMLSVPKVWVVGVDEGVPTIVVERYDRYREASRVLRLHQEDLCQALGIGPENKYQSDGGPSAVAIINLLRDHSDAPEEDVATFIRSLALNWVLHGTDGHAKNYAVLHHEGPQLRLAPLYDVASLWPYDGLPLQKRTLALSIGGENKVTRINRSHWERFFRSAHVPIPHHLDLVREFVARVPQAAAAATDELRAQGITHPVIEMIATKATAEAKRIADMLQHR